MTTLPISVPELCLEYCRSVDAGLEKWLPQPPDCPKRLAKAMHYAVFPGGKRIRAVLTLMSCRAAGGQQRDALPPACAVELVHCYSLVHDDLPAMDDDDLRRGRPTVHKAFDEATAILVGDALLTLAFDVIARHTPSPSIATELTRELAAASGAMGMVGGQVDDMLGAQGIADPRAQLAHLHSLHARKTGALLLAAVRMGAVAARACGDAMHALETYGRLLGLAFQIADDLLDVTGDPTKVGKRVNKDQTRGKLTFPGLLGAEQAAAEARELVSQACLALEPLGPAADELCDLAHYIVERDQ